MILSKGLSASASIPFKNDVKYINVLKESNPYYLEIMAIKIFILVTGRRLLTQDWSMTLRYQNIAQ